MYIIIKLITL